MSTLTPYQVAEIARKEGISTEGKNYQQVEAEVIAASKKSAQQKAQETAPQAYEVIQQRVKEGKTTPEAAQKAYSSLEAIRSIIAKSNREVEAIKAAGKEKAIADSLAGGGIPDEAAGYKSMAPEPVTITRPGGVTFSFTPTPVSERTAPARVTPKPPQTEGPTITETLRGARDTIFSNPVSRAQELVYEAQRQKEPIAAVASPLGGVTRAKAGLDVGIGFVKAGESIFNPKAQTAGGALVGTGISLVTGQGPGPYISSYAKDIEGRPGEFLGEVLFDVVLGKAIGKGISEIKSRVGKKLVGTPADKWLLEHSSRYKRGAEATLRQRPQILSSPVYDVGQPSYTWSAARQKAIDLAWELELTPGTSGVTAPALLETSTKTKLIPHLFSRGGFTTIGYLRDTGFTRSDPYLQSAPQQIGVTSTVQKESVRALPYTGSLVGPTLIGKSASKVLPSFLGPAFLQGVRATSVQETKQAQETKAVPLPAASSYVETGAGVEAPQRLMPELKPTTETIESPREIPYTPTRLVTPQQTKQVPIPLQVPDLSIVPAQEDRTRTIPEVIQVPEVLQEQDQQQKTVLIPGVVQAVRPVQKTTPQQAPVIPTPQLIKPSVKMPYTPMFELPKLKGKKPKGLFGEWRLRTHKVPTISEVSSIRIGSTPKKRKRGKGRIKSFKI